MHVAFGQRSGAEAGVATWRASFPEPRPDLVLAAPAAAPALSVEPSSFGARAGPNWLIIAFIVGVHAVLLFALVKLDVISIVRPKSKPLVVDLLMVPPDPPATAPPEQEVAPPEPVAPTIVVPKPVVVTPAPAPTVIVTRDPPPLKAVIVAPAAPTGPVSVDDLSSKMIFAPPPRYPALSLRRKEQGTVYLAVAVAMDGSVAEIRVSRSSGSDRLDKAALEAVRRWRWSPSGQTQRGFIDIPFVLQG